MIAAMLSRDPPPVLLFVLGFIVFAVVIAVSISRSGAHKVTLENVARKMGGTFVDGGLLSEPSVSLRFGEWSARLEFWGGSKNSSPYTKVSVDVGRASPGNLHILEQGFGQAFLKLFGAQDLEIGDPSFDRDYVIKATPSSIAARLFSRDRQLEGIRVVRRLQGTHNPTFDCDAGTVTVMVRQYLREEHELVTLIECARDFTVFAVLPAAPAGIVLEEVKVVSGGECPVCGTTMTGNSVRCEACRTPHHSECWHYMGRCSTYACKGKRSIA